MTNSLFPLLFNIFSIVSELQLLESSHAVIMHLLLKDI
jgi:hypothetical protein